MSLYDVAGLECDSCDFFDFSLNNLFEFQFLGLRYQLRLGSLRQVGHHLLDFLHMKEVISLLTYLSLVSDPTTLRYFLFFSRLS